MLQQIVVNTPVWVWALLAFLVYRGVLASIDRETSLKKAFIIPVIMLLLSIQGIVSGFGDSLAAGPVWLAFLAGGTMLTWLMVDPGTLRAHPERGMIAVRGSWTPMVLMLGIFLVKYVVAVMLVMHPDLRQQAGFVAGVCALYGVFNGIFIGKLLRIVAAYRAGAAALPA
ncbi:DUF6622 family protein [Noviherbaspirillum galbum]|uniref:Transmembrane protein n=1 Tax=Noviherbaspirillum galbum TaxID=2709383 RepID=A0A6B3SRB5_9BURK|nr:DUF6622 family protein [Noviherbaspirillum galbum]NEX63293.1 hypothetical protein [Noviherbaspirillum galbum]